jgi:pimeloyl-ACP methyl ester carboxylesterase
MNLSSSIEAVEIGDVHLELERRGSGAPLLLLASEEARERDSAFVDALAARYEVILPSAPGFGRSSRPEWATRPDDIAYIYLDLLDRLHLRDVPVVGASLGGWIAAEMATIDDAAMSKLVLLAPYGIKVGGPLDRDITDLWLLHPDAVRALTWFEPANAVRDYTGMSEDELRIVARNVESFARLCWEPYMFNPKLTHRLHRIGVPTLLLWGADDGIVRPAYGEAYRRLIPGARLAVVEQAGHFPHLEQPAAVTARVVDFLGDTA